MPRLSAFLSICIVLCCRLASYLVYNVVVGLAHDDCPPPLALLLSYFHFHFLIRLGHGYGIHGSQLIGCIVRFENATGLYCTVAC